MRRRGLRAAGALVGLVALVGLAGSAWTASRLYAAAEPGGQAMVFEVTPGESLHSVVRRLEANGLLPAAPLFGPRVLVWFARATGVDRAVKSGEYDLDPGMRPVELLAVLVSGAVKTYPVTLPEGLRIDEVAARLEAVGLADAEAFLARARDPELAEKLGIEAESSEGYLYPETYRFPRQGDVDELLTAMVEEFRSRWTDADREALAASGLTLHEALTLASIVEKETSRAAERSLISAVFHNRLRIRMPLQSDPTVIYGILYTRGSFDGNLRKRDLTTDTPYNTYRRRGLPPGPIASTTIESIRAVLAPADVPYLYFVSKNDGTHQFSKTLREHTRAVNQYQRRGARADARRGR